MQTSQPKKKRGRPAAKSPRFVQLSIRLTVEEAAELTRRAKLDGTSCANVLRECLSPAAAVSRSA